MGTARPAASPPSKPRVTSGRGRDRGEPVGLLLDDPREFGERDLDTRGAAHADDAIVDLEVGGLASSRFAAIARIFSLNVPRPVQDDPFAMVAARLPPVPTKAIGVTLVSPKIT